MIFSQSKELKDLKSELNRFGIFRDNAEFKSYADGIFSFYVNKNGLMHEFNIIADDVFLARMKVNELLNVNRVMYFEHNKEAVGSAKSVGIRTHYWDSERRPLRELALFLEHNT